MKNLIQSLPMFFNEIISFGITEVFVVDGEIHTTSDYTLPFDLIEKIELEALKLKEADVLSPELEHIVYLFLKNWNAGFISSAMSIFYLLCDESQRAISSILMKNVGSSVFLKEYDTFSRSI